MSLLIPIKPEKAYSVRLDQAKERAEAIFKRKEKQAAEGAQAWAEYQAKLRAIEEKTERLRALRLSKDG